MLRLSNLIFADAPAMAAHAEIKVADQGPREQDGIAGMVFWLFDSLTAGAQIGKYRTLERRATNLTLKPEGFRLHGRHLKFLHTGSKENC